MRNSFWNRAERSLPHAQPSNVVLVTSDAGLSGNMVSRLVRACQLPLFAGVLVLPLLISHMLDPSNMIALLPERWHGAEANRTGESFAEAWTWRLGCESSGTVSRGRAILLTAGVALHQPRDSMPCNATDYAFIILSDEGDAGASATGAGAGKSVQDHLGRALQLHCFPPSAIVWGSAVAGAGVAGGAPGHRPSRARAHASPLEQCFTIANTDTGSHGDPRRVANEFCPHSVTLHLGCSSLTGAGESAGVAGGCPTEQGQHMRGLVAAAAIRFDEHTKWPATVRSPGPMGWSALTPLPFALDTSAAPAVAEATPQAQGRAEPIALVSSGLLLRRVAQWLLPRLADATSKWSWAWQLRPRARHMAMTAVHGTAHGTLRVWNQVAMAGQGRNSERGAWREIVMGMGAERVGRPRSRSDGMAALKQKYAQCSLITLKEWAQGRRSSSIGLAPATGAAAISLHALRASPGTGLKAQKRGNRQAGVSVLFHAFTDMDGRGHATQDREGGPPAFAAWIWVDGAVTAVRRAAASMGAPFVRNGYLFDFSIGAGGSVKLLKLDGPALKTQQGRVQCSAANRVSDPHNTPLLHLLLQSEVTGMQLELRAEAVRGTGNASIAHCCDDCMGGGTAAAAMSAATRCGRRVRLSALLAWRADVLLATSLDSASLGIDGCAGGLSRALNLAETLAVSA